MAKTPESPIPAGMNTITTHFWYSGNAKEAVEFYQKALGAELMGDMFMAPDGKSVWHAMIKYGNSHLMLADVPEGEYAQGPKDHITSEMWCYVEDCDAAFNRAVEAGCEVVYPMSDAFWGDRFGKVKDPFGHVWSFVSHKFEYTEEEMNERMKKMMEEAGNDDYC